jgi:hypothetical protein
VSAMGSTTARSDKNDHSERAVLQTPALELGGVEAMALARVIQVFIVTHEQAGGHGSVTELDAVTGALIRVLTGHRYEFPASSQ